MGQGYCIQKGEVQPCHATAASDVVIIFLQGHNSSQGVQKSADSYNSKLKHRSLSSERNQSLSSSNPDFGVGNPIKVRTTSFAWSTQATAAPSSACTSNPPTESSLPRIPCAPSTAPWHDIAPHQPTQPPPSAAALWAAIASDVQAARAPLDPSAPLFAPWAGTSPPALPAGRPVDSDQGFRCQCAPGCLQLERHPPPADPGLIGPIRALAEDPFHLDWPHW